MDERLYDDRMRRTSSRDCAFFAENSDGTRAIRCIRIETLRAFGAFYAGQTAGELGSRDLGDHIEIEGMEFAYTPGPNAWYHQGDGYSNTLLETCAPSCAAQWLRVFKEASTRAPGFIGGVDAHHFVGARQAGAAQYVALARKNTITWFNHSNGFLLATGLAEATKGGEHEISAERFIHNETCYLYESSMLGWLQSLTEDINRAFEEGSLLPVAEELNFDYLPERIKHWRNDRASSKAREQDEDMAAEFLVEAYAHTLIESKELPSGVWTCLDSVVSDMHQVQLRRPPPSDSHPMRVMPLPEFIDVPQELADRANMLAEH